jgi:hypothetical protein
VTRSEADPAGTVPLFVYAMETPLVKPRATIINPRKRFTVRPSRAAVALSSNLWSR